MALSRKLTDDELIEKYVVPDPNTGSRARARIWEEDKAVPIWALIAYLQPDHSNAERVAHDYQISMEALAAAVAYYQRNKKYIDAWSLLNSEPCGARFIWTRTSRISL